MISAYTSPINAVPAQLLSYKEKIAKGKKWAKECVDSYEILGRRHYHDNLRFLENYQMLNGRFFWHHYIQEEGYKDWLTLLTQEFEVPSTLRHYDIIGKVVNNLSEKLMEFPDVFRVEEIFEEDENNEYVRTQTELMHQSVKAEINREITAKLIAAGYDPNKQDFATEEEAMAYFEEMQQLSQAMTPSQIQEYMETSWQSQGEIWGTHQLKVDKQRYRLNEMERREFRDMLITDRCFRHFFLTGDGYQQETWNPVNTFYHVSPDIDWVEDGDFVGRIVYMTKSDIINRYGWKMTEKQIKKLEQLDKDWRGDRDLSGFPYKVYAPFEDFKAYTQIVQNTGFDPLNNLPVLGDEQIFALTSKTPVVDYSAGLYRVTELYWKSQRKLGKFVYLDPETGELTKTIVDENFVVPEGVTEKKGDFYSGNDVNTVYWTWVNEIWRGKKICYGVGFDPGKDDENGAIYLDLEPCEFQFKGDYTPYGCKLPVCGRTFNNRNAQSMSLVDLMKPHQIGYNVCMNQLYQLLEKEIGKFIVWDAAFFNTMKDWGGEDSWEKISLIAKELGHVFGDTSPRNMQGANPNNTLPKEMNLELTAQMFSRARLAEFFEARALAQLGVSSQFIADVKATETATGINTAMSQTQLNVQKYYTDFFEYKQRCLTMSLDIAQFVQSQKRDITISYTKSDASRAWIKLTGTDLLLRNMHVYVVNSQELLRQLEMIRSLFINNNTTNASPLDLVEIITSNSPAAIKVKLREVVAKQEQMQAIQIQQQQQQLDQQAAIAQEQMQREDNREHERNETKKEVAYIQTFGRQQDNMADTDMNQTPDVLEYAKLSSQNQATNSKVAAQRESNQIKREQTAANNVMKARELDIKEQTLKEKQKDRKARVQIAKTNKNRFDQN